MQTLTVDLFVSVDGWARGEDSPGFFGYHGPELDEWIAGESAQPQLALLGRRTYELLAGIHQQVQGNASDLLPGMDKVVFSTTLTTAVWPNTRVCADAVDEVARLKKESDVPLRTMGSLSLARQFLDAGLVDRVRLMTFPLLVGKSGREAMFADVTAADLELVDHRVLDGRLLLVEYRPTGKDIPRA